MNTELALNFSTVGRDITQAQREEYYEWDKIQGERKNICDNFNRLFNKHFYACVGGKISIDIQKQGEDKSQIYHYLSDHDRKIFFGDKCEPGGNDYALANLCEVKFNVDNWRETWDILTNLIIPGQNEKARVFTVVKGQTYDPQGTVINSAAKQLGIKHIKDVKAGRHFLLLFEDDTPDENVKTSAEEAATRLLHNDIIEDYDITYEL